ncbi:MAG: Tim44 domain-containing protein [Alphaproteobacteria bacterium]|nr:Tim44 domain-containing protein [Alphaproteobacteria bacterium]
MNSQLLLILLLAMVAAIILFRLYSVLGRRTGHERSPQERFERLAGRAEPPNADVPAALPRPQAQVEQATGADEPLRAALLAIKLADRKFETDHFLDGARRAYEIIVTGFARGDRAVLRPLLGDEVYAAFDQVISTRESKKEKNDFTFVGFRDVKITDASLNKNAADIVVSFAAQFISATVDASGAVVEGDPKAVRDVTDVWSFERNVRATDPNWRLVATSGEADLQGH